MPRLLPLLLVLSSACGSTEYARGVTPAVRPARPAFTPSGAGLPSPEHPDAKRAQGVRPGPRNTRHLEPSERPGIYAADGDARRAMLLRIRRPVPGVVPDGASPEMWRKCWADVVEALLAAPEVEQLSEEEMECARHLALAECGGWLLGRAKLAQRGQGTGADNDVLARYFPSGRFNENAWDEAMNNLHARRRAKRCEGAGAYTELAVDAAHRAQEYGRETKQWRDGVP